MWFSSISTVLFKLDDTVKVPEKQHESKFKGQIKIYNLELQENNFTEYKRATFKGSPKMEQYISYEGRRKQSG